VAILLSIFNRGVGTGPSATEDRTQTEFSKGSYSLRGQQCIQKLESSVSEPGESMLIERLPKLDQVVNVLFGRMIWFDHTNIVLPMGGWRNPRAALTVYLNSSISIRVKNQQFV
jgi:hypothetical protein